MPADTIPGTVTTIKSSDVFYGKQHLLPVDAEALMIPLETGTVNDWMLPVIILGLLFFIIAWYYFSSRIKLHMKAVFSWRFFHLVDKEGSFFKETPNYLLFGNFLLTISLLIYQTLQYYDLLMQWVPEQAVSEFAMILLGLTLFYPLKLILISFLAWVFATPRASYLYFENIFLMNNFLGLLILPLVFYNAFNPYYELLLLMWATLIAANIYKLIRGAYIANRESGFSVYYLFLYLCAVEIAPLFVMGKAVATHLPGFAGVIASY